jgi:tetratricopeptide (TPR) repeat protein
VPAPKKKIDAAKLRFLIQRRKKKGLSQKDAAAYLGLRPSARDDLRDWENGVMVPPAHHRSTFIRYLIDKLDFRDQNQFNERWKDLAEQWEWEEITDPLEWQEALAASLPLDTIPEPALQLPPGSRMPFRRNPLFVGREADLRHLATLLKGSGTAVIGQITAATGLGGIGTSLHNLAKLLRAQGDYAAARPLHERALAIYERALGPEHPHTAAGLRNLGKLFQAEGNLAEARPHFERAITILAQRLGSDHPDTCKVQDDLAALATSPQQAV